VTRKGEYARKGQAVNSSKRRIDQQIESSSNRDGLSAARGDAGTGLF